MNSLEITGLKPYMQNKSKRRNTYDEGSNTLKTLQCLIYVDSDDTENYEDGDND